METLTLGLKNLDAKGNQATWSAEGDVSSSDDLYTWRLRELG